MTAAMTSIVEQLHRRFPLLSRLTIRSSDKSAELEPVPAYLGMVLAVMQNPAAFPVCFVFPKKHELPRLVAVLYGVIRLAERLPELIVDYVKKEFEAGARVRVHPGRHVFYYMGPSDEYSDRVWLAAPGGGRRTFPISEMLRLQPTTGKTPKGKLNTLLSEPPPAPLDKLLGATTHGNQSIMANEVLMLDSRSGLETCVRSTVIDDSSRDANMPPLFWLLPFGDISAPEGERRTWLGKWNALDPAGEPLVAVTNEAETLANYCIDAAARTKTVIINGLTDLRNSIQVYDDISQTQRLILFANQDEEEMIEVLGNRGCRFWRITGEEVLADAQTGKTGAIFGPVTRCARNSEQLEIDCKTCEDEHLAKALLQLEGVRKAKSRLPEDPISQLVHRAWRLFGDACGALALPETKRRRDIIEDIGHLRTQLDGQGAWLSPEEMAAMRTFTDHMELCYGPSSSLGAPKGAALRESLDQALAENASAVLLARRETQVADLRLWLDNQELAARVPVYSPRTLPRDEAYERLIINSWLGADMMKQMASRLAAPRLTLVGYPWEIAWLNQCRPRFGPKPVAHALSGGEKSGFVWGSEKPAVPWPEADGSAQPPPDIATVPEIWNFERQLRAVRKGIAARPMASGEAVRAYYVSFTGDAYAFLTDSHKLPVATELAAGRAHANKRLPEKVITELGPDDFVVFPESGDREFIQEIADKIMGEEAATKQRRTAHRWKDALKSSKMTADEFYQKARELGHRRHPATVRNWFAETSQIGPREEDDLVLIALVTGDAVLEREVEKVRAAIKSLWGVHLSAGNKVRDALLSRLPNALGAVEENGTKIDLGELGAAWVVQVDAITAHAEQRGRNEVNRLLFDRPPERVLY
jgi:HPt (histidine-containing phosphotransfer) domain-containing protein